jgi:hypothetical protein
MRAAARTCDRGALLVAVNGIIPPLTLSIDRAAGPRTSGNVLKAI